MQHPRTLPALNGAFTLTRRTGLMLLGVVSACGLILFWARPDAAQSRPASASPANTPSVAKETATKAPVLEDAPEEESSAASSRRPLDYYTGGVRGNLFTAPQPPEPKPAPVKKAVEAPKPKPVLSIPVAPINPFAGWTYTGTVRMGDQTMALLENAQTKDGQYVKVGDSFLGAQVTAVSDQMVTLTSGGKPNTLVKSDNITVTPLSSSAPVLSAPSPGQPGMPGMPGQPQMPGQPAFVAPPGGNMPNVILPNGRMLTPDQAARRARRLNRQF